MNFLRTELETATTFVVIAGQATFEDKISRNIAKAREACRATRYFMDRIRLSEDEAAQITEKLAGVEDKLAAVADSFSREPEHSAN